MEDKNFFSPNFSSLKHCTNKNENLAFLQPYFPHCFPVLSEGLHQLLFDPLSCLGLHWNVRYRKTSVYLTKWCGLEHCWVLLSAAPYIKSSGVKCEKLCLSENQSNFQFVLIICNAVERDSQLFSGTVPSSKGIVIPLRGLIVKEDSWKRWAINRKMLVQEFWGQWIRETDISRIPLFHQVP